MSQCLNNDTGMQYQRMKIPIPQMYIYTVLTFMRDMYLNGCLLRLRETQKALQLPF